MSIAHLRSPRPASLSWWGLLALLVMALGFAATADAGKRSERNRLDRIQYDWSAAIRWGDLEGAWNLVDPEARKARPMTDLDFSRYQQVQVSAYRTLGSSDGPDGTVLREVRIEVINRHTLSQREVRYTEVWRYDREAKTWWNTAGLPDFWAGQ